MFKRLDTTGTKANSPQEYHALRSSGFKITQIANLVENTFQKYSCSVIVDVGFGAGSLGHSLKAITNERKIIGLEPNQELFEFGKQFYNEAYNSSLKEQLIDENALIVLNDVYHHIDDTDQFWSTVAKANKRVIILIIEPNCINPFTLYNQCFDEGIRLSFPFLSKNKHQKPNARGYLCAGKDKREQSFFSSKFEGTIISGAYFHLYDIQ